MPITREFLEQHVMRMNQQIAAFQGAVEFAEMLLKTLDEPDQDTITLADLQKAVDAHEEEGQAQG